jgi:hypothetical protein
MKIIFVSAGNFQSYLIDNIKNLKLFGNNDITVITEKQFFPLLENLSVTLVDTKELNDFNFNKNSHLDRNFRNGFWHLCSLRFFYLYSYIKNNNLTDCIHLENDVITYVNFDELKPCFTHNKVYVTYDSPNRVIPGIIYIPDYIAFQPIIENYNFGLNDMQNLANFDLETLPISLTYYSKNFSDFYSIFDAAAMGQYLGGVDKRNQDGDTRGFVNETCIVKYNNYKFVWYKINNLYIPHLIVDDQLIKINNLHIHSKELYKFMADNPLEEKFIKKIN